MASLDCVLFSHLSEDAMRHDKTHDSSRPPPSSFAREKLLFLNKSLISRFWGKFVSAKIFECKNGDLRASAGHLERLSQ